MNPMFAMLVIILLVATIAMVHQFMVITQPDQGVIVTGNPLIDHLVVETATTMIPGNLVTKGTADKDIIVCTASTNPVGWLSYEYAHASYQPADRDTAYGADEFAPVAYGGGFTILGTLASGNNVTKGMRLKPAAAGQLDIAVTALTIDAGTTAVTSTLANGAVIAGDAGGIVVAIAMESVNASAAAKRCAVLSLI